MSDADLSPFSWPVHTMYLTYMREDLYGEIYTENL